MIRESPNGSNGASTSTHLDERIPNKIAEAITGRGHISFTQISMMRSCSEQFRLSYVEKARPDFVSASLLLGGAIHAALEAYFQARMEDVPLGLSDLMPIYRNAFNSQADGDVSVKYGKDEDARSTENLAQRMIAAFLESPHADVDCEILAIEEPARAVLHDDLPDVVTRLDLMYRTEGAIHVVDFKTSRSRWSQAKAAEAADQLILYREAACRLTDAEPESVRLGFIVLTKTKTAHADRIDLDVDAARIERTIQLMLPVWHAIKLGVFYPSPNPITCGGCAFKSHCRYFADE